MSGVLFVVLAHTSPVYSENVQQMDDSQRNSEIKIVDSRLIEEIAAEKLQPWLLRYHTLGDDFVQRNSLAFRFSNRNYLWWERMSLMAFDLQNNEETQAAITHLASAYYTNLFHHEGAVQCLRSAEPQIVAGQLRILRSARVLRPDGSDRAWPAAGPLDPKRLPKHIAMVLKGHPLLAIDVAQTLEVYGPLALKEAGDLVPLLLSKDTAVFAAAQSAIRKMDPQGVAKLFRLDGQPLTTTQRGWIQSYLKKPPAHLLVPPIADSRESDGSPQSEMSQRREELWRYLRYSRDWTQDSYTDQMEIAFNFRDQKLPGDWWRVLSSVEPHAEAEFGLSDGHHYILNFASAFYTKPGAQAEVIRLFQDEDYRIAQGAMGLVVSMRLYKPTATEYDEGELVDPEVMPAHIIKVLERHPYLRGDVAGCLSVYGSHASREVEALVPFLLLDDTTEVQRIRWAITDIDPVVAQRLEITLARPVDLSAVDAQLHDDESVEGPSPLTPRQLELIQTHLKSRRGGTVDGGSTAE